MEHVSCMVALVQGGDGGREMQMGLPVCVTLSLVELVAAGSLTLEALELLSCAVSVILLIIQFCQEVGKQCAREKRTLDEKIWYKLAHLTEICTAKYLWLSLSNK
eukprot:scaffold126965_cov48-Phaeocystis_antarctica.AAC.2